MTMLPVAEARDHLSRLVGQAESLHERVEISRNGRRAAVLLGADDFDSIMETLAIAADSALVQQVRDGVEDLAAGRGLGQEELTQMLGFAGVLPGVSEE
ncbi:MAG: type II toxin-antitoxin system Phd/YefM family antitoxin [Bifidobacteriaceae bacterium]|jgi:prevent-host-death family protein|nr:type II toxin-antitoxin system Phd/YefM family antitoxin [Bifidobacteriaceae bacterium]